jgi:MinD-like ATPase involved in chromosome partitioning or flagellar assembly
VSAERPRTLLALTPIAERAIEPLLFGDDAPAILVSSVAEADELEREARESGAAAALVSPQLSGLTGGHCARVRAAGLRLVGLALDERDREALNVLGIDQIVDADAPPGTLAGALEGDRLASARDQVPRPAAPEPERMDTVLSVVGSKGAPGSSECAASLAALASARWPTLLVELDALAGDLDVRVGADPQRGSLLGVLRATESESRGGLGELLERWLVRAEGWPPVLLGPPRPGRTLYELAAAGAVNGALRALAGQFAVVVCDVGFLLGEGDHVTGPAERAHREAVVSASAVLLVLGAREGQLRHGLDQLDILLDDLGVAPDRLRVIVNAVGTPGAPPRTTLEDALADRLGERRLTVDAWLPWDRRAVTRALRAGSPLAVARRRGPYARSLRRLIDELFLPTRPAPRGRKHRLQSPASRRPREIEQDEEVPLPW